MDSSNLQPNTWAGLWRGVTRIDRSKINGIWLAGRNSIAVAVPLATGIAIGNPLGGVAVATGALNVSYSDGVDPYAQRARRMLAWSLIGAIAVFTGTLSEQNLWLATLITMAWAFVAGLQLAISTRAGDLGLNTLVTLVVFSARAPGTTRSLIYGPLLVLGGGLIQTAMGLLFWPVNRHEPERHALASVYAELARGVAAPSSSLLAAPLQSPSTELQDTLSALGRDHSIDGERFRYLFDQVDRMRVSAFTIQSLETRRLMTFSGERGETDSPLGFDLEQFFSISSQLLLAVSQGLLLRKPHPPIGEWSAKLHTALEAIGIQTEGENREAQEIGKAVDIFAGQVRSVARLVSATKLDEEVPHFIRRGNNGWRDQLTNWLDILRANLSFGSATFRHAIRMAVCVGVADSLSRSVSWQRSYWIPMTVAVILKPDFTTTLSRGLLRLFGTLTGLVIATALYRALPGSAIVQLFLVGIFTLILRLFGGANYGIFSVAISGLIVFLISETGVPPSQVVALRGTNTLVGGLLALAAYILWPTWERKRVGDVFAELVDATRLYFHALKQSLSNSGKPDDGDIDQLRQAWRRARTNAEGSVDKVASEPNFAAERLSCLNSMLASSRALVEAIREMEVGILPFTIQNSSPALDRFFHDVDFTLYYLAAALRGSESAAATLPKLREDHRRLVQSKDTLGAGEEPILLGTDRITTTLNTLREQVMRYIGQSSAV